MLCQDIEIYVRSCNVYLISKAVCHKPYRDFQSLPISTHWWKNLSMDFVIGLLVLVNWKSESYDLILVIVDQLTKMVYYVPVNVTINAPGLAEVIINVVLHYHGIPESIVTDQGLLFIFKFWSSLCNFLRIKKKLSTAFYHETNGLIERQNSTIKAYLRVLVHWKQNHWVRLLVMAEFAYNNTKNTSTSLTLFELNCGYHPKFFFEGDVDPCWKSCSANKLAEQLKKIIEVCCQNLLYAEELQKRAYDKGVINHSYAPSEKTWLNSKFIKTKRNKKLKNIFFEPFRALDAVKKQAYKL